MTAFTMSKGQLENYNRGEIERMQIGLFRCVEGESGGDGECGNDSLWEAPLEEWWEPRCCDCMRPALLVEPVDRAS